MRKPGFLLMYCLVLIAQILLLNFCNFSQYLIVTFLPVMVLCIPIGRGNIFAMIVAFITGFITDFLADGMIGLTSLSLVPVALVRRGIIQLVFGSELFSRGEEISVRKQGVGKIILASLLATGLFLAIYIWVDGAGTRPFWFNATKWGISLAVSTIVSYFICDLLTSDDVRWK